MKKLFFVPLVLIGSLLFAHFAVYPIKKFSQATGNLFAANTQKTRRIRTVEFKNAGTKEVVLTHLRFHLPYEVLLLSPDELTLLPGESVKERFSETPQWMEALEFYVRGTTESLEVSGIID